MLSVRLPEALEAHLTHYCDTMQITKSFAVQTALENHLKRQGATKVKKPTPNKNPFLALVGSGNGRYTTDQVMQLTRGDDWNQA